MIRAFKGNYKVNNPFGTFDPIAYANYPGFKHPGTDYPLPWRTPLFAPMNSVVSRKLWGLKLRKGNELIFTNGNLERRYAHMDEIIVPDGPVAEGTLVGYSGYTGYVIDSNGNLGTKAGSHLHDELLVDGVYISLEEYLKGEEMIPDIKHLDFMFQQFFGRNSIKVEQDEWIGQKSYTELIDVFSHQQAYKNMVNQQIVGGIAVRDNWEGQIYELSKKSSTAVPTKTLEPGIYKVN